MNKEIKIGRNNYVITSEDRFMDNGSVVQLRTQSKEKSSWGQRPDPCLSKKLYKELCRDYEKTHITYVDDYGKYSYFNFKIT